MAWSIKKDAVKCGISCNKSWVILKYIYVSMSLIFLWFCYIFIWYFRLKAIVSMNKEPLHFYLHQDITNWWRQVKIRYFTESCNFFHKEEVVLTHSIWKIQLWCPRSKWNMGEILAFLYFWSKFSNKNDMVSAWRNFKNIFSRPLFTIIFRPEMLKFHPYSILTGTQWSDLSYSVC